MKNVALTPTRLRTLLFGLLFLLVVAGVGTFMFGYDQLKTFAQQAQETAAKAEASTHSLEALARTKKALAENVDAVSRASQLVSESKSYVYQDQIISDLNKYASEAGVGIENITFTDAKTTAVTTPAATSGTDASAPAASGGTPAGVKSMSAVVTLANPVDYSNLLTFITLLEQSLFKMQISQVGISRGGDEGKDANKVTSDPLTIEVYVR